jgi:type IV pilus assembly protein PilW
VIPSPTTMRAPTRLTRMKGASLVELMVATTISLVMLAAVGWVYQGSMQTYRTQDAMARMQEGARFAFELIGKDLRMAGATGCSYITTTNVVKSAEWYANLFAQPISSLEKGGTDDITDFSDALVVLRADVAREHVVTGHDGGASQFTVSAPHGLSAGQLMVATDCSHASVFQASAAAGSTVNHLVAGTPGNNSANLGVSGVAYTYSPGSRLYRLNAASYYVDENTAGIPTLFRLVPSGASAELTAEELVEGVEDFQVSYAVDSSSPADGQADFLDPDGDGDPYLTGTQVNNAAVLGGSAEEKWRRVVSVRVSLLMRTAEDRVVPTNQNYQYNGESVPSTDLRLRKVFTHVIKLRNR